MTRRRRSDPLETLILLLGALAITGGILILTMALTDLYLDRTAP